MPWKFSKPTLVYSEKLIAFGLHLARARDVKLTWNPASWIRFMCRIGQAARCIGKMGREP